MGIQEDIYEEFFLKLEEDGEFPKDKIEELKKLLASGKLSSQENIFEIIQKVDKDVHSG